VKLVRQLSAKLVVAALSLAPQDAHFAVEYLAHPAGINTPGHAWICIYRGPAIGPAVRNCYGFYPKSDTETLLGLLTADFYPAVVKEDDGDVTTGRHATVGFRQDITQIQFASIQAVVNSWKGRGYSIAWQNCADFLEAVALAAGLAVPQASGPKYPPQFVESLGAANPVVMLRLNPQ
jgi:hypothetical protein